MFHKLAIGTSGRTRRGATTMSTGTFLPVLNEVEKASIRERQPLPERYLGLSDDEMAARIAAARATLGDRLVILGHHYQRDEVIRFADYTGDSFKLSREVAKHPDAEYIVFCGVHFMAESADVLALPHQKVILPDLAAGCSMADMAPADELEICWSELEQMGMAARTVPVTYINSAAAIKCVRRRAGRHRLHLVERRGGARRGAGSSRRRSCSCPISTWAATPPTSAWACRSTRWWCGIRTSRSAD